MILERERGEGFRGEPFVEAVLRDLESSGLDEKEKALFRFVDKVNHDSPRITAEDMIPLHTAGWDDAAIYYAITVCALFNFYNRWIDATGVHDLPAAAYSMQAQRLKEGYLRPAPGVGRPAQFTGTG